MRQPALIFYNGRITTLDPDNREATAIAIRDTRAQGQRILPLCPFVRAHAQKHREELADVIQW